MAITHSNTAMLESICLHTATSVGYYKVFHKEVKYLALVLTYMWLFIIIINFFSIYLFLFLGWLDHLFFYSLGYVC